jgi:glycosyltransferase involved in cell wall biosynthesis
MKIIFIGQKGIPALSGGVEKQVESLAINLVKENQEVLVYNRSGYGAEKITEFNGVKIISKPFINTKNLASISHNFLATLDVCRRSVDIVHYHGVGPSLLIALIKLIKPKTKVVATLHSFDYYNNKWGYFAKKMLRLGEKIMFKLADEVIVLSPLSQKYARENYKKEVNLIPNGVKIEDYPGDNLLQDFNLSKDSYILTVARLIKLKGIQYLIEAFKDLKTDKKLVIVGDGEYKLELQSLAAGDDRIIFTNNQSGQNLKQLFANAYLFVQPSEMEGLSISLLEAMSYGLPCLVSDIEANISIAESDFFCFKSKDKTDLKKQLENILNTDNDKLKEIGKRLKDRVKDSFESSFVARKTLSLYQKLLKKS